MIRGTLVSVDFIYGTLSMRVWDQVGEMVRLCYEKDWQVSLGTTPHLILAHESKVKIIGTLAPS